jgi:hypothetical protein
MKMTRRITGIVQTMRRTMNLVTSCETYPSLGFGQPAKRTCEGGAPERPALDRTVALYDSSTTT